MKIYVDKMPKSCNDCPCKDSDDWGILSMCNLEDDKGTYLYLSDKILEEGRPADACPLQSLAEHDKRVRKQVVGEIRRQIISCGDIVYNDNGDIVGKCCGLSEKTVMKILDQVERSEKDEKS